MGLLGRALQVCYMAVNTVTRNTGKEVIVTNCKILCTVPTLRDLQREGRLR